MTTPRRGGSLAASYDTLGASFAAVTARKRFTDANETAGDETACRRRRDWRQGTRGKTRWDRIRGLHVPGEQERREEARYTLASNAQDGRHNETGCADVEDPLQSCHLCGRTVTDPHDRGSRANACTAQSRVDGQRLVHGHRRDAPDRSERVNRAVTGRRAAAGTWPSTRRPRPSRRPGTSRTSQIAHAGSQTSAPCPTLWN